jgi:hypothetical protein
MLRRQIILDQNVLLAKYLTLFFNEGGGRRRALLYRPGCTLPYSRGIGWEIVHQAETRIAHKMLGREPEFQDIGAREGESHRDESPRRACQGRFIFNHGPVVAEAWQVLQLHQ